MAAEKLYELHADGRFDLVVIDTPPTRNALDFLEAPGRLTRFLDHRLYRLLMAPTRIGRTVANVAAQAFTRTVSRVVGDSVIADVIAFFQAFDGMEAGFRDRAKAAMALLQDSATRFVVIASPAIRHRDRGHLLRRSPRRAGPCRLQGWWSTGCTRGSAPARRADAADAADAPPPTLRPVRASGGRTWPNCVRWPSGRRSPSLRCSTRVGAVPVGRIPLLATDVHDLDGLGRIAAHLFAAARGRPITFRRAHSRCDRC